MRDPLIERLRALGLGGVREIALHRNTTVVLSETRSGVLRLHEGFRAAPDRVLRAIVRYLRPGTRRAIRRAAHREIVTFPVELHAPPRPRRLSTHPDDRPIEEELARRHTELNERHFGGRLGTVRIRVSRRMRTRLGHLTVDPNHRQLEIAISRRHVLRDGWDQAEETLLHEMIHQWQAEQGHPLGHGQTFKARARALGICPQACRQPERRR